MRGPRLAMLAAGTVVLGAIPIGPGRAAAEVVVPDTDTKVRAVHAMPLAASQTVVVSIDGVPSPPVRFGAATPGRRLPGGRHEVIVTGTDGQALVRATFDLRPGCEHTLLMAQPEGVRGRPQIADVPECVPASRLRAGHAGVRLLNTAPDNGAVALSPPGTEAVPPMGTSARSEVPAGRLDFQLRSPSTGEVLNRATFSLAEGRSYSVLYAGAGDYAALGLYQILDGSQPPDPPNPDTPINVGSSGLGGASSVPAAIGAVGVLAAAVWRRGRRRWPVALALVATACGSQHGASVGPPPTSPTTLERPSPKPPPADDRGPDPPFTPTRIVIPTIGVDAIMTTAPSESAPVLNRTLDGDQVALLSGSSPLGELGVAIAVGHVSWGGRPAVLGRLGELSRGDTIQFHGPGGRTLTFVVRSVSRWPKAHLPENLYGPRSEASLLLVTCTGEIDPATGLHRENLLVEATL